MSEDLSFPVEEWSLREMGFHLDTLAQTESIFALSNGHIGLRGNLDEGEPSGIPGMHLNSFYEALPLPYVEPGYGYPESYPPGNLQGTRLAADGVVPAPDLTLRGGSRGGQAMHEEHSAGLSTSTFLL